MDQREDQRRDAKQNWNREHQSARQKDEHRSIVAQSFPIHAARWRYNRLYRALLIEGFSIFESLLSGDDRVMIETATRQFEPMPRVSVSPLSINESPFNNRQPITHRRSQFTNAY
jgi:hypothetical protein